MIRTIAAVVLAGTMLTSPSVTASASEASTVKFVAIQSQPNHDALISATGAIHAPGTDVIISDVKDRFQFPDGNLIIKHKPAEGGSSESFDPVTCLFKFVEKGTWKTLKGTGAYTAVQGSGTYKTVVEGFGCEENQAPDAFYLKIVAKGDLTY